MLNEALSDVKVEGDNDPFKDLTKEKETPSESATEKEPIKDEATPALNTEKQVPFHEDPRWQEMHAKAKRVDELEAQIAELNAFRDETKEKFSKDGEKIPSWFGGDLDAWNAYKADLAEERKSIKEELRAEQIAEKEQAEAQQQHWNNWVDENLTKLEASGKKFDRNELIKVMLETRPTDQNGNFDFEAGYKTYEYRKAVDPVKSQARKAFADSTSRSSRGEGEKARDYRTPADFRGKSWNAVG